MIDLQPYAENYDDLPANTAMAEWLAEQPQDVWVSLAGSLNWDNALPTMHWMIEQPSCERAVAAAIFWLGADALESGDSPEEANNDQACRMLMAIARRASTLGYPATLIPDDDTMEMVADEDADSWAEKGISWMPGQRFPMQMFGPFGTKEAVLPADAHPVKNSHAWDLFSALGTNFGERPAG